MAAGVAPHHTEVGGGAVPDVDVGFVFHVVDNEGLVNGPQKKPEARWAILPPASDAATSLSGEFRMDPPLRRRSARPGSGAAQDSEETPIESEVNALSPGAPQDELAHRASGEERPGHETELADRGEVEPYDSDRITEMAGPDFEAVVPDSSTRLVETIPAPASADEDEEASER